MGPPIQSYHTTYGECQALNSKKIVNFAFTLPPLLPHGGGESLVADISSIILQDYDKCQTPLKDDSPECPQTSNVFVFSVSLHNLCRANNRHRELVTSHHTDKQKG